MDWCEHREEYRVLGWKIAANGRYCLRQRCSCCGKMWTDELPSRGIDKSLYPVWQDMRSGSCEVCGAFGTDKHHWAPSSLFGTDKRWSKFTVDLCKLCHEEWHWKLKTPGYGR